MDQQNGRSQWNLGSFKKQSTKYIQKKDSKFKPSVGAWDWICTHWLSASLSDYFIIISFLLPFCFWGNPGLPPPITRWCPSQRLSLLSIH